MFKNLYVIVTAQSLKGILGSAGRYCSSGHIDSGVGRLDVGSLRSGAKQAHLMGSE